MKKLISIFVATLAIFSTLFWGCKKDSFLSETELTHNNSKNIEVSEVKNWYSIYQEKHSAQSASSRSDEREIPFRVTPVLELAYKTQWDNHEVIISPIEKNNLFGVSSSQTGILVFTKNTDEEIHSTLLIITGDREKYKNTWELMKANTFSGGVMSINEKHEFEQYRIIENGHETGYTDILSDVEGFENIAKGRDGEFEDDAWPPSWWPFGNDCPNPNGSGKPLTPKVKTPKKKNKDNGGGNDGGDGWTGGYLGTPVAWTWIMPDFGNEQPVTGGIDPKAFCQNLATELNIELMTNLLNNEENLNATAQVKLEKLIQEGKLPGMILPDAGVFLDKIKMQEIISQYTKLVKLENMGGLVCENIKFMYENPQVADVMYCYLEKNAYSENARDVASQTILALKEDLKDNPNLISNFLANGGSCDAFIGDYNVARAMKVYSPKVPIIDLAKYLKCFTFNSGCHYSLSICADQPVAGTNLPFNTNGGFGGIAEVGHAFLILKQECDNGGPTVTRVLGFYPKGNLATPLTPNDSGQLGSDANHSYDVKVTYTLNDVTFQSLIASLLLLNSSKPDYNLNTFNCTTWVVQVLSMIGINAPSNTSTWPFGKGLNPGQFGEDLKKWGDPNSTDKTGGNAPANVGTCF